MFVFQTAYLLAAAVAVLQVCHARSINMTAREPPPSNKITIEVATINGSGCARGTAAIAVSEDNTAFTVTYSAYVAQIGPGVNVMENRKNCQLNLIVRVPNGYTYAVASADYRGYASVQKGVSALQRVNYYFQGQSQTGFVSHSINYNGGSYNDNWQATDSVGLEALVFAPCGDRRNLNLNTELRLSALSPQRSVSYVTMDSTDADISTKYNFAWARC
jgi:hypothetical protein